MTSEKIIQFYPKDSSNVFFSDMTDNGFDENCIHFCPICEQFERCKGQFCNYYTGEGLHTRCRMFVPFWQIAKYIGLWDD